MGALSPVGGSADGSSQWGAHGSFSKNNTEKCPVGPQFHFGANTQMS